MIPSLPEVVTEVMRMLNDVDSSISDFEAPLSQDAALVARMLKLVNSPFYGVGRQVSTIGDSIAILGFRSLRSMVLAASTGNFLERDFSCYGHSEKGLWYHSICVASGAKRLATHLGTDPNFREEVFVAGLLHDIGKMLLASYLVNEKVDLVGSGRPAHEVEMEFLGIDHQEAGAIIGEKWKISPLVQAVLRHHHSDGGPEEYKRAISIVRLADVCSQRLGKGYQEGVALETDPPPVALEGAGVAEAQWEEIVEMMTEAMEQGLASMIE